MPKSRPPDRFDLPIFIVVVLVIVLVLFMLVTNIVSQYVNYRDGINAALATSDDIDHAAVITYTRAWDFAVVKTSALFISFLLILIGALYVLRAAETQFQLSNEVSDFKAAIFTNSPGLAMVFLGVILAALSMYNKTAIEYKGPSKTAIAESPAETLESTE